MPVDQPIVNTESGASICPYISWKQIYEGNAPPMPTRKQSGAMLIMFLLTDVKNRAIAELSLNDTAKCWPFESQAKLCGWPPTSPRLELLIFDKSAIGKACLAREAAGKSFRMFEQLIRLTMVTAAESANLLANNCCSMNCRLYRIDSSLVTNNK